MLLKIAERLKPFSHTPGTACLLPGSFLMLQVFPSLLKVYDLSSFPERKINEFSLDISGPVADFTIQLDLEKNRVTVWGSTPDGFFRYHILPTQDPRQFIFSVEKAPADGLKLASSLGNLWGKKPTEQKWSPLSQPCKAHDLIATNPDVTELQVHTANLDRLSLGNHKSQDWDLVCRRTCLEEILPVWLRLGQLLPQLPENKGHAAGTLELLEVCRRTIQNDERTEIYSAFQNLFAAGFEGILVPQLEDKRHLGFKLPPISEKFPVSPLLLLQEGAKLIRSLFIQRKGNQVAILPALPPEFHCGRLLREAIEGVGYCEVEWSKKEIRQMAIIAEQSGSLELSFPKYLKRFRLRTSKQDKGTRITAPFHLELQPGAFLLDKFE